MKVALRTNEIISHVLLRLRKRTDRMFAWLMGTQYLFGIVLAVIMTPEAWTGTNHSLHINLFAAVFLGGLISGFPIYLALKMPGTWQTRHLIAVGQILTSALLIHITGGRVETHFHIFGSLAFLVFYRDWRVILTATLVVVLDHALRGFMLPQSVYGITTIQPLRFLEHAGWVVFIDFFLILAILDNLSDLKEAATIQAKLEYLNCEMDQRVIERTKQLTESNQRFNQLAENIEDVFFIADGLSHNILYISPAYEKIWGRSCQSLYESPQDWFEAIHLDDRQHVIDSFLSGMDKDTTDEYRILRTDGETRWIRVNAYPVKNDGGQIDQVVGIARDVTNEKKSEDKIKDLAKFPSEDPNPVFRISGLGTMTYTNRPGVPLLDLNQTAVGHTAPKAWLSIVHEVLNSGATKEIEIECGDQLFVLLFSPSVNAGYVNVYGMNVTDRKNLEKRLLNLQKMEAVGVLAGGVAHEFNNLLTTVTFSAGFIKEAIPPENPLRKDVLEIEAAVAKAGALTQKLLAFSQKNISQPRAMNVNEILLDNRKILTDLVGENIEIEIEPGENVSLIKADPAHIMQMIISLSVNAREAMPQGGRLSIKTSNLSLTAAEVLSRRDAVPGSYVVITVSDNGKGIDSDVMPHLFEPFFTTKGRVKGTGLGLASVYGMVRQAGGFVEVESQPNAGATFKIYFPNMRDNETVVASVIDDKTPVVNGATILLVEDEKAVRSMAARSLSKNGFNVIEAGNGEEALAIIEQDRKKINLVVTDLVMPKMGGIELIQHIQPRFPDVCLLVMSGYSDHPDFQRFSAGDTQFLQKPFTPEMLCDAVAKALDVCSKKTALKGALHGKPPKDVPLIKD